MKPDFDYLSFAKKNNSHRVAGIFYIFFTLLYIVWLFLNLNYKAIYISLPFLAFQMFSFFLVTISIINGWKAVYRTVRPKLPYSPPPVAVVVCTYKEPVSILRDTLKSILNISYSGEVVIILSNDDNNENTIHELQELMLELSQYWNEEMKDKTLAKRGLFLLNTISHSDAKAGNLNQALSFLKKYHSGVDLVLTQDADEVVNPEILDAVVGYFNLPLVAYVQTIKQVAVSKDDPFGNRDLMWYGRIGPSRDSVNAMFACGSGVIWRISALESIGGFSTWNLVEDLKTSYDLLAKGWQGRYHYEALSKGLAPEDLPNYIKQRGTWAMDHMRIFFWDNPLRKKDLSFMQKLQFLETPLFYFNGFFNLMLVIVTALSLILEIWPTTQGASVHAMYLIPSFLSLEAYYLLYAGKIPFMKERQFWIGLAPVFIIAVAKALFYGPNRKPTYIVTRKENVYGNYVGMVLPQIFTLTVILLSLFKILIATPLYSEFDWAAVFWGFYLASFFIQTIRVSWWKWEPVFSIDLSWGSVGETLTREFDILKTRFSKQLAGFIWAPRS